MRSFHTRRLFAPLAIAIACAATFAPADSTAAPRRALAPPPQVTGFEMDPIDRVAAGAELFFSIQGTPGSRATVRVAGVSRAIVLQEVEDGVYEGSYTLRPKDRATPNSAATVTLKRANRSTVTTLGRLSALAGVQQSAPVAQAPQPAVPTTLQISRFNVRPIEKIEPGAELRFTAEGTPGARASVNIDNVASAVPLRETRPGHYEGTYTIRRFDRIIEGMPIVATLEAHGQTVRSNLARGGMLVDARPPTIRNLHPRDGEVVHATGPVSVSGTFDDRGGVGVDPASVRITLGGRDVTSNASISREFFTYRAELAPGRYVADVSARDSAGNPVRSTWDFRVEHAPTAAVGLPLVVTSHAPNATVSAGRLNVRGRTAPHAAVDVEVTGLAAVAGMIGVSQKLYSERVIADANGNFDFSFQPQFQVPGMRYEVDLKAHAGNQTRDTKLVLFQQR
jgi:hypothetical protein